MNFKCITYMYILYRPIPKFYTMFNQRRCYMFNTLFTYLYTAETIHDRTPVAGSQATCRLLYPYQSTCSCINTPAEASGYTVRSKLQTDVLWILYAAIFLCRQVQITADGHRCQTQNETMIIN